MFAPPELVESRAVGGPAHSKLHNRPQSAQNERYADCMKAKHRNVRIVVLFGLLCASGLLCLAATTIAWNFDYFGLHSRTRWLLHSNVYKAGVLSEPSQQNGLLKHVEWDGWGLAGNDTTVYLVFDPSDMLATPSRTAAPGKYPGLPCEVARVKRLERYWYTVLFYTQTNWNFCG